MKPSREGLSLFLLQARLLQDTSKCPKGYIQASFTGNGNGAGLHGMTKLTMTTSSANELPAVVLEHSDDFANLHGAEATTRLEQPTQHRSPPKVQMRVVFPRVTDTANALEVNLFGAKGIAVNTVLPSEPVGTPGRCSPPSAGSARLWT